MNNQSTGRNQRSKGLKVKQALQFALLLAVCIWLLYQIMHSHDERKDYGGNIQSKLSEELSAVILGRKGNAGWSNDGGDSDSEVVNLMGQTGKKEDGGAGDDELDRNPEEKAEEESYLEENENVGAHEGKENRNDTEREHEESQVNENNNRVELVNLNKDMYKEDSSNKGNGNALGRVTDHDKQVDEKDAETIFTEPQNNKKDDNSTLILDKEEAVKENDEDNDPKKMEKKFAVQAGGMVNDTAPGRREMEDGVHSFNDETGVPQDVNDVVGSKGIASSDDKKINLHQGTISNSNNQSRNIESMPVKGDDIKSKGGRITDVETDNKGALEDSRNDRAADAEINSETSGASSINHASATK